MQSNKKMQVFGRNGRKSDVLISRCSSPAKDSDVFRAAIIRSDANGNVPKVLLGRMNQKMIDENVGSMSSSCQRVADLLMKEQTSSLMFLHKGKCCLSRLTSQEVLLANTNANDAELSKKFYLSATGIIVGVLCAVPAIYGCVLYLRAITEFSDKCNIGDSVHLPYIRNFLGTGGLVTMVVVIVFITASLIVFAFSIDKLLEHVDKYRDHKNANATTAVVYARLVAKREKLSEVLVDFVEEQVHHFHKGTFREHNISAAVCVPYLTGILMQRIIENAFVAIQADVSDDPNVKSGEILPAKKKFESCKPFMARNMQDVFCAMYENDCNVAPYEGAVIEGFLRVLATNSQDAVAFTRAQIKEFVDIRLDAVLNSLKALLAQKTRNLPCFKAISNVTDTSKPCTLVEKQQQSDVNLIDFDAVLPSSIIHTATPATEYQQQAGFVSLLE